MSLALYGTDALAVPIERSGTSRWYSRKSRWEKRSKPACENGDLWAHAKTQYLPPPFVDFPSNVSVYDANQFLKEQRLIELNDKLLFNKLELGDPDIRPPSPAPQYDSEGNRTNNRETVAKNQMIAEQQRLTEAMVSTVPGFEPPPDFKTIKKVRRILIPQSQYPDYNFMGLIIGPRGCNHKRLESESGAQISIRGQGTQKDGRKCDHQTSEEMSLPQHVHIAADTEEKLEKAVALIEPLLDPSHPIHEEYKKKGLQQLAQVTGNSLATGRTDITCTICNSSGHYSFECPETKFETYERADVKCLLCGDRGHVTLDCYIARERGYTPQDIAQLKSVPNANVANPGYNAAHYQSQSNYQGTQSAYHQNVTGVAQYFMQSAGYGSSAFGPGMSVPGMSAAYYPAQTVTPTWQTPATAAPPSVGNPPAPPTPSSGPPAPPAYPPAPSSAPPPPPPR